LALEDQLPATGYFTQAVPARTPTENPMSQQASQERNVILTFDDGPEPVEALEGIVSILDAQGIKACFFLLGQGVERQPAAVRMLVERGHEVANHNWEHVHMPTLTEEQMFDQLRRTQEAIRAACGVTPKRLRVPFGDGWYNQKDPALLRSAEKLGLELIGWTLDTLDWKQPRGIRFDRVEERMELFVSVGRTSCVELLLHVYPTTVEGLPRLIQYLRGLGFGFTSY
jgi:peptidoglycan/xylan/chitin deacetylase (PgdA/CDA1 family)